MPGRILLGFRRPAQAPAGHTNIKSAETAHNRRDSNSLSGDSRTSSPHRSSSISTMDTLKELKRHSIGPRHPSDKKSPKGSPKIEPAKPIKMSLVVESPPLVLYDRPANSSGALFSSTIILDTREPSVTIDRLDITFLCTTTARKPVVQHCPSCTSQTTELKKINYLPEPLKLTHGTHEFPLSYLFPGHLPATTHGSLGVIDYHIAVEAHTTTNETISLGKTLEIKRAIPEGPEKHSLRIFPPTNLTAQVTLPPIIHPIGTFSMEMRLAGVTTKQKDAQVRWRLRKLNWRIEERQKFVSPACTKHSAKVGGEGKGVLHEDTRILNSDEVKSGWKSDFNEGIIELIFPASINSALRPVCDVDAPNGLVVTHFLIVEMVVAEEWSPHKRPSQVTPTGAARVLRTQFQLTLSERSGLGIAWDEEQPPMYEDVPDSPPRYAGDIVELSIHDLSDEENFSLDQPIAPVPSGSPSPA